MCSVPVRRFSEADSRVVSLSLLSVTACLLRSDIFTPFFSFQWRREMHILPSWVVVLLGSRFSF